MAIYGLNSATMLCDCSNGWKGDFCEQSDYHSVLTSPFGRHYVLPMIAFIILGIISCGFILLKFGAKRVCLEMWFKKNIDGLRASGYFEERGNGLGYGSAVESEMDANSEMDGNNGSDQSGNNSNNSKMSFSRISRDIENRITIAR